MGGVGGGGADFAGARHAGLESLLQHDGVVVGVVGHLGGGRRLLGLHHHEEQAVEEEVEEVDEEEEEEEEPDKNAKSKTAL